jgi:hypothetical protein
MQGASFWATHEGQPVAKGWPWPSWLGSSCRMERLRYYIICYHVCSV